MPLSPKDKHVLIPEPVKMLDYTAKKGFYWCDSINGLEGGDDSDYPGGSYVITRVLTWAKIEAGVSESEEV